MTRKFEIKLKLELDDLEPFDASLIQESLRRTFSDFIVTTIGYPKIIEWDIVETTKAKHIAVEIANELSLGEVKAIKQGDNGPDDIGFELKTFTGSILADIGIKKEKGIWNIYLERDGEDIHISRVDDLVDNLVDDLLEMIN